MRISAYLCAGALLGCNDYRLEVLDPNLGAESETPDASSLNQIAPTGGSTDYEGDETFRYLKLVLLSTLQENAETVEISEVRYSLDQLEYPENVPLSTKYQATSNLAEAVPENAFDGEDSAFRAPPRELPATLTLDMSRALPAPDTVIIFSGEEERYAPGDFELRGSLDGAKWVILGQFSGWETWSEPEDEYDWERQKRSFSVPPSSEWREL